MGHERWAVGTTLVRRVLGPARPAFSEFGEDLALAQLFRGRDRGFYVDLGANHPFAQSNTYMLYRRGWTGLAVDASPLYVRLFRRFRPKDVAVHAIVSATAQSATFYDFGLSDMSTLDPERAARTQQRTGAPYRTVACTTVRLDELLWQYVPAGQEIDLMSVDLEGADLDALQSNDWERFRPGVLLVERHFSTLEELIAGELYALLRHAGYELVGIHGPTLVFLRTAIRNLPSWPYVDWVRPHSGA